MCVKDGHIGLSAVLPLEHGNNDFGLRKAREKGTLIPPAAQPVPRFGVLSYGPG
jgi:hypothetical protein